MLGARRSCLSCLYKLNTEAYIRKQHKQQFRFANIAQRQGLLFVAVFVVNAYQATAEGEYFAEGDEDGVVNLCQWWADEARA